MKHSMKKLEFIPSINAVDLSSHVREECTENDISTHYQSDIIQMDWDDEDDLPKLKRWLVETYGEEIRQYDWIALHAT